MTDRPPTGVSGARHLASRLTAESLQSRDVLRATDADVTRRLLPDLIVLKVGGASIIDRGPEALLPVVGQLAELAQQHRLIICAGEGARARHAYMIAQDLGLPAGMLSVLGNSISEQNALILSALLMEHGAVNVPISLVPTLLTAGTAVITSGMPPYEWWEPPPPGPGRIPDHRTDVGTFLIAEAFGAHKVIYVKDQDGLYTADPAVDSTATPISQITATDLLERHLPDLPLEPVVIDMLARARSVRRLQLINGLVDGLLARAVLDETVGTIITAS